MKNPLKNFSPNYRFNKITGIPQGFFSGAELIIFDLDNTLVFSETTDTTKEIAEWTDKISRIYNCVIVSNSPSSSKRAENIFRILNCKVFSSRHRKPFRKLYEELKIKYGFENGKVFVVGDRLFTDILFGNLNKIKTVLVNPLEDETKLLPKIVRKTENLILFLSDIRYN